MHSRHQSPHAAAGPSGINNSNNSLTMNSRFGARHRVHQQEQADSISDVLRHYDDRDRLYHITIPRQQFQLGGYQLRDANVPRGRNGIDAMERDMREVRLMQNEGAKRQKLMMKLEGSYEYRAALEDQMTAKTRMLEETRRAEMEQDNDDLERNQPYGPSRDERRELEWTKRQQQRQKAYLEMQISDKAMRDAEEAQHFAAPPPDWEGGLRDLDARIHKAIRGDASLVVAQSKLLDAGSSAQPRVIQDARESQVVKKEQETKPISQEVANFADRILLAERARRDQRERYKAELDAQVRERNQRKQSDLYNNIIIDRSYHFGALERAAPPTPEGQNAVAGVAGVTGVAIAGGGGSGAAIRGSAQQLLHQQFSASRSLADHYSATPQRLLQQQQQQSGTRRFW